MSHRARPEGLHVDLNQIAAFVRVVETEGFTAAAKAMRVPKSTVSRGIARLEEELGVRLLHRTTRKLSLTEAGRAFYEQVSKPLGSVEDALIDASDNGKEPRGTVRITAPSDVGTTLLAEPVAQFIRKYPQIRIELSLTNRMVDLVQEGYDLAVRAGPARLDDSSLVARKLGPVQLGLFASPAYLRKRGRPKSVKELATHDCVLFRAPGGKTTWRLNGPDGEESVEVKGPIGADDILFLHRALLSGLGIGLLPTFLCMGTKDDPSLVRVLPDRAVQSGGLHLVAPTTRNEPARVKLFREHLLAALAQVHWEG